jgi:hypothetical protein
LPFTSGVAGARADPPEGAEYHLIAVPVAVSADTLAEVPEQKVCAAAPVGASGEIFTVAVTSRREVLSQPLTV